MLVGTLRSFVCLRDLTLKDCLLQVRVILEGEIRVLIGTIVFFGLLSDSQNPPTPPGVERVRVQHKPYNNTPPTKQPNNQATNRPTNHTNEQNERTKKKKQKKKKQKKKQKKQKKKKKKKEKTDS